MTATANTDERTKVIDGQYTMFQSDASGGVLVYTAPDPSKDLPKLLIDCCPPEELYDKYQGLIKSTIYRLGEMCRGFDQDDLVQEGRIALWTAAQQFDPFYGTQFKSYAITILRRSLMHYVKDPTSKLFGGRRLDVVSVQELQERVDDTPGSSIELFAAPEDQSPAVLSERDEIIDLLTCAAEEISLVKERKGIQALIMQLQGIDSKTIAQRMGIAPKSYSALVAAGRKALKNNPKILSYISLIKNQAAESVVACLLGDECVVKFSDDAIFDTTKYTVGEHLAIFSELLSNEEVAEQMLNHFRVGEDAVILDEDTWTHTWFHFGAEEILLQRVSNTRSRSTVLSRSASPVNTADPAVETTSAVAVMQSA